MPTKKYKCECKHDRLYSSCKDHGCRCVKHSGFKVPNTPLSLSGGTVEAMPTNEKSEKPLNPGIKKTVEWLNNLGFKTTDSGDGKTHDFDCDQPCPYVHIIVSPENLIHETIKLKMELKVEGIDVMPMNEENSVPCILSEYNPAEKFATISLYNVMI